MCHISGYFTQAFKLWEAKCFISKQKAFTFSNKAKAPIWHERTPGPIYMAIQLTKDDRTAYALKFVPKRFMNLEHAMNIKDFFLLFWKKERASVVKLLIKNITEVGRPSSH